jgi:hypothetical protein
MKVKCRVCGELFAKVPEWRQHAIGSHASANFDLVSEPGDAIPKHKPTPKLADECKKLLDNGWTITLFTNALGSYTAKSEHPNGRHEITDDFEPSQALYRLTEKVYGNIV